MRLSAVIALMLFFATGFRAQKGSLLPDTLNLCQGDSGSVEIRHQFDNNATISWSTPQGIITNTKKLQAPRQGKYFVRVSQAGQVWWDSCYVKISPRLRPMMRDTFLCRGRSVQLDARQPGMRYLWSNGETSQRITVESPGRYWVKIRNGACTLIDTVMVKSSPGINVVLPPEVTFCMNEDQKIITAKASQGCRFQWSTGVTTASIQVTKEGTYWLRTELRGCGTETDSVRVKFKLCECEMIIPNSFTPNEDNRNDYFFPVVQCEYSYFSMTITDRWGNTVYTSNNINAKWDGRFKGNLCPEDIYIYRIESTEKGSEKKLVRNGRLSLFR